MDNKQQFPINPNLIVILLIVQFFFSAYLLFKMNTLAKGGVNPTVAAAETGGQPTDPNAAGAAPTQDLNALPALTDEDHVRGSLQADVVLVEYSDLECPFCKNFHETMKQVKTEYGDKVAWVHRHYPLSFHPKAQKAAEAVECANELGGPDSFWTMVDTIFERMPNIEVSAFPALAAELGLDQAAFTTCLDSGKYAQKVKDQQDGGSKVGVSGTPNVVMIGKNGKRDFLGGAYPIEDIKTKIDALMQ